MSDPQPTGDPHPDPPAWKAYPDPIPAFVPVPARLLTPVGTAPALAWWALDGWAIPQAVYRAFVAYSDDARLLLLGRIQRVGWYSFSTIGPRCVVVTNRAVLVCFPELPHLNQQVQTVLPLDLAAQIRALPSLPPLPGAPPVT
jgi:hypothetical protein